MRTDRRGCLKYFSLGMATVAALSLVPLPWSSIDYIPWSIGFAILIYSIITKKPTPVLAYAAGVIIPAVLFATVFMLALPAYKDYTNRMEFDSRTWKHHNTSKQEPQRIRMIDSLLEHKDLIGMHYSDIIDLLGQPEDTAYFKNWDMVYWLGPERGYISIDSEWLVLRYDQNKTITEYRVVTD